jgi:hypothetical protein
MAQRLDFGDTLLVGRALDRMARVAGYNTAGNLIDALARVDE